MTGKYLQRRGHGRFKYITLAFASGTEENYARLARTWLKLCLGTSRALPLLRTARF